MPQRNLRIFLYQLANGFNIIFVSNCGSTTPLLRSTLPVFSRQLCKMATSCSKMIVGTKILICIPYRMNPFTINFTAISKIILSWLRPFLTVDFLWPASYYVNISIKYNLIAKFK